MGTGIDAQSDAVPAPPARACGEADDLPKGVTHDDTAHTLSVPCDGDARGLVVTVLDDGIVRLRYGSDLGASDLAHALVAIARPPARAPLVVARTGSAATLCTKELVLSVDPHRCALVAKEVVTGAVVLDDTGGGFFQTQTSTSGDAGAAELGVVHASPAGERFYGLGLHTGTQPGQGLDLRGKVLDLVNTDAYDSTAVGFRPDAPSPYETIPFYLAADGDGRPTTMAEVHNAYAYFEARATFDGMAAARPAERPFVLSRAAFAGQQKWSAVWTGDTSSTWTTLGMTLHQLLHPGMSGIAFAGSDVGGYSGREESTADLFSRWMALGAVSPFFRAHGEKDARRQEPWAFGTETLDATRAWSSPIDALSAPRPGRWW